MVGPVDPQAEQAGSGRQGIHLVGAVADGHLEAAVDAAHPHRLLALPLADDQVHDPPRRAARRPVVPQRERWAAAGAGPVALCRLACS